MREPWPRYRASSSASGSVASITFLASWYSKPPRAMAARSRSRWSLRSFCRKGPSRRRRASATAACHSRLLRIGVELLVEPCHRLVERLAVDAGEAELLAGEPVRAAAPVQRARLGLGEGLVVDHAGIDELRDDGVDRLLHVVDHRRLGHLRLAHPAIEHAAQALGRAGIALEIERGGVLQVLGGDRLDELAPRSGASMRFKDDIRSCAGRACARARRDWRTRTAACACRAGR